MSVIHLFLDLREVSLSLCLLIVHKHYGFGYLQIIRVDDIPVI